MYLLYPWCLLALLPVVAAALYVLIRPSRRSVTVPSLALWKETIAADGAGRSRRLVRADLGWLLVFAGLVAAVLALCGTTYRSALPCRIAAMEIVPSAEIATARGMAAFRSAGETFLRRFSPGDRIMLRYPIGAGGRSAWCDRNEAIALVRSAEPFPAPARRASFAPPPNDIPRLYRFAPFAATAGAPGNRRTAIAIPPAPPPVTVDRFSARVAGAVVEYFAVLRRWTARGTAARFVLVIQAVKGPSPAGEATFADAERRPVAFTPGAAAVPVRGTLPAGAAAIGLSVRETEGPVVARSWLARRPERCVRIAIAGDDEPILRRYVEADPLLQLRTSPREADVVVANGVAPPPGVPALVIDPPAPPPGWLPGNEQRDLVLETVDYAAGDPVMMDVEPGSLAIRRVAPWRKGDRSPGRVLIQLDGRALALRTEPAEGRAGTGTRRVFTAFALSAENTNLPASPSFVVFLANVFRWLAPGDRGAGEYRCIEPLASAVLAGVKRVSSCPQWDLLSGNGRDWRGPGLYVDGEGIFHAVAMPPLDAAAPQSAAPADAADVQLPDPVDRAPPLSLWPVLAVAAVLLWGAGWYLAAGGR